MQAAKQIVVADTETFPIAPGNKFPLKVVTSWRHNGKTSLTHNNPALRWDGLSTSTIAWVAALTDARDGNALLVGHNMAFDLGVFAANTPEHMGLVFDALRNNGITCTLVRERLRNIAYFGGHWEPNSRKEGAVRPARYDLGHLSRKHKLDNTADKEDPWRMRYGELWDDPLEQWPEGAVNYSANDTVVTEELYLWQANNTDPAVFADEFNQMRKTFWLALMSAWGICTNTEAVQKFAANVQEEHDKLETQLIELGLVDSKLKKTIKKDPETGEKTVKWARPRKQKVARDYMYRMCQHLGIDPILTDSGEKLPAGEEPGPQHCSLSEDACALTQDPTLKLYGDFGVLKALWSKDIPMLLEGAGATPIHSRFTTPLETGRVSSSSPNIQNIRRLPGIRECFVPRAGHVFASADYDGLELRTLAQVCLKTVGWSSMAVALNVGQDPHVVMAADIAGGTYEELEQALKDPTQKSWAKNLRQTAKVANFGFPGGLGSRSLVEYARAQYGVIITEDEARNLKKLWLKRWPEFVQYFRWISSHFADRDSKAVITQMFSERLRGNCRYTQACNTMFQGLGGDATGDAGFEIAQACYVVSPCPKCNGTGAQVDPNIPLVESPGDCLVPCEYCEHSPAGAGNNPIYGSRLVNYVHDEFILETLEGPNAWAAAEELQRLMVLGASKWLPDVPPTAEPLLMRYWSKDAEAIRDEKGRLIPWPQAA